MLLIFYKKVSTNASQEAQSESVYWAQCSVLFNQRVTEPQNCWGRHLCRSPCPTGLHKQDHVELVTQDRIQMTFEKLQRWRLRNLPEQSVSLLYHRSINFFSSFYFEFSAIYWNLFTSTRQVFKYTEKIPLNLLFSNINKSTSHSLFPYASNP